MIENSITDESVDGNEKPTTTEMEDLTGGDPMLI